MKDIVFREIEPFLFPTFTDIIVTNDN